MAVAVVLVVTAGIEVIGQFDDIGAHHGVLVFGIATLLDTLLELPEKARRALRI